ncbi:MAG: MOSC N-terminal beta barrel domain-containing protein [Nitrospirota bacterium]|nr:MOSC N-terminal beta barrel domain-containing protein [Nitrospirota bacterium]
MSNASQPEIGTIVSMWRYPVKSMGGEKLSAAQVRSDGLIGDRSYAILDPIDGKVATAKNPRKWPTLFSFNATCVESGPHETASPVRITLPDGTIVASEQADLNQILSKAFNREVQLIVTEQGNVQGVHSSLPLSWTARSEEYWADIEGRDHRETVTDFALPTGTFFDAARVHLLTTATLQALHDGYPQGCFDVQRFRPNLVVDPVGGTTGFAEHAWIGQTLAIGEEVRLCITVPCGRCVMTTLPQRDLPKDPGILMPISKVHTT